MHGCVVQAGGLPPYFSSAEVNLAVLKLMLIHPETSDAAIIRKILMKALLSVPSSDFQLCMYQIPERLVPPRELPNRWVHCAVAYQHAR